MAVQFPGSDYFEVQAREDFDAFIEEGNARIESYFERVRRINYSDWLAEVKSEAQTYCSGDCIRALEEGKFDKRLEKAFKKGETYVWAVSWIVIPWDVQNGTYVDKEVDDSVYE